MQFTYCVWGRWIAHRLRPRCGRIRSIVIIVVVVVVSIVAGSEIIAVEVGTTTTVAMVVVGEMMLKSRQLLSASKCATRPRIKRREEERS